GFESAIALASRPAASTARLGITTLSPGTWVSQLSRLCECCAAPRWPAPPCVRTTSGTVSWPPDMKCAFAAAFASWSSASVRKSTYMISSTGRSPAWAAPIATPVIAASLIGVLITRETPNSSASPAVAVNGPPSATSSPSTITRSSPRIASASARLIAPIVVVSAIRVHHPSGQVGRWERALPREAHGALDPVGGRGRDPAERLLVEPARRAPLALEPEDRVLLPPLGLGERLAVAAGVALVVPAHPVRQALEQERPSACPRGGEEPRERLPHLGHVVAVDRRPLDPVRRDDVRHPFDDRVSRPWRELGVAVVLADEDERQRPERREVDRLHEVPRLDRAVAEEHHRDRIRAAEPRGERAPERERDGAAEAAAEAGIAPHQLGHDPLGARSLRERVPVRAVARVRVVVVAELRADR